MIIKKLGNIRVENALKEGYLADGYDVAVAARVAVPEEQGQA